MNSEGTIEIAAPAATVWNVFTDVERWPEWTASVERITCLDGPGIGVGKRFEIEQPGLPKLVWVVTEVEPGVSWTWRTRSTGATATAVHEITPLGAERTRVRQSIEQRGLLGAPVGWVTRRRTERYLALEAEGLKASSEQRHGRNAPAA
jgi:uncharacterized protein YndB with AHSA1/START domain